MGNLVISFSTYMHYMKSFDLMRIIRFSFYFGVGFNSVCLVTLRYFLLILVVANDIFYKIFCSNILIAMLYFLRLLLASVIELEETNI